MTVELVHSEPALIAASSPVAFADAAASAVAAQVSLDAHLTEDVARRLVDALVANMTPWFNQVAENERASVARFMRARATSVEDGSMIGTAQSEAINTVADRVAPTYARAAAQGVVAGWGPVPA